METIAFIAANRDLFLIVVAVISLFIGSLLNVIIYRLPHILHQNWSDECRLYLGLKPQAETERLSLWLPFSHCPSCRKTIRPWHNIPLLSYIWLMGKCAYCQAKISIRYPVVELLTCLLSVLVAAHFGFSLQAFAGIIFTWILICLTFIDLDHQLLPDQLTFLLLWTGLFCSLFSIFCSSQDAIIGAMVGYLIFAAIQTIFELITHKTGMGQGDYKLLAALGAFLGWKMLPLIVLLASLSGMISGFAYMLIKRQFKSVPLPFGPYLAISGLIALLWGNELIHYYLQVM